ncbi:MAG: HI0074 family nucleotidyltransferase substrate-binding subunit [Pseudomonadota bacterium]
MIAFQHWRDSFLSLGRALDRLEAVLRRDVGADDIVLDAAIQRFEFSYELFWKALKRAAELEGQAPKSPKEAFQTAYALAWIEDEDLWIAMLRDRNQTTHAYDREKALDIYGRIKTYYPAMRRTYETLRRKLPAD